MGGVGKVAGVCQFTVGVVNGEDGFKSVLLSLGSGDGKRVANEILVNEDIGFPV